MRRLSLPIGFISLLIALPLGFVLLYPALLRCMLVRYSADFDSLEDAGRLICISRQASPGQKKAVLTNNRRAVKRIAAFWGSARGEALLIYCHSAEQYARYCGGESAELSAGCSLATPWGASYLVLGPEGSSADVIAHERCHDELLSRLGWWRTNRQIPQWFNEGLALMVDYRFTNPRADSRQRARDFHDEWEYRAYGRQMALSLKELQSMRDFFGGDYHHVMLAYYTGAAEVARWLALVGDEGPAELARRVRAGGSFDAVYASMAQERPPPVRDKQKATGSAGK